LVISLIALFVALGGTSLAASNVVASRHQDALADTRLVKKLAPALSVKRAKLAQTASHAFTADGAVSATNATNATNLSGHPAAFYAPAILPSGQSESGVFGVGGDAPGTGYYYTGGVTFPIPVAHALDASHVVVVAQGAAPQPHCSGEGHADPGYLCLYTEVSVDMQVNSNGIGLPDSQSVGAAPTGFVVFGQTTGTTGGAYVSGTWTVTAG
jgi:hypothetical protein